MNSNNNFNPDKSFMSEEEAGERRESRKVFSLIGFGLALPLILIVLLRIASYYFCPAFSETDVLCQSLFSLILYLLCIPAGWLILKNAKKRSQLPVNEGKKGFPLFILLFSVAVELAVVGIYFGNFTDYALSSSSVSTETELDYAGASSLGMGLYFLLVLIVIPLTEELFFRKALLDILSVWGSKTAIILSALFYAAFHGNLTQFFYSFGLGLVLSYAYLRTGKLRYPLIIHFIFNLLFSAIPVASEVYLCQTDVLEQLTVAVETWASSAYTDYEILQTLLNENPGIIPAYTVNSVISFITMGFAVGGAAVLLFCGKRIRHFKGEKQMNPKTIGDTVFMSPGIMLFLLCSIILTVLSFYSI